MSKSANPSAPLLQASSSQITYGTTSNLPAEDPEALISSSSSSSTVGDNTLPTEKTHKEFKEIWPLCLGLWTAVFCSALSATIVANLQIEIGSYFRAGSLSSWLGTSYLLGLTAMTPLYGRLAQVLGRKGAMLLALTLFFTGTIMCAISPSMNFILVARCIAGAGSGGLLTVTAIIISDLVSLADRGLYQGGVNVLFGAGAATGAVLGGWVADVFGWRMAFWMQILPISIASVLVITKVHVPHHKTEQTAWQKFCRIDWAGSFILMVSISSLSVASSLMTSSGYQISNPLVYSLLIVTVVSLPLFAYIEKKAPEPILPLSLLTKIQPSLILLGFAMTTATTFARLYMQPVYLHVSRGLNGSETGLLLLPSSLVGSASSLYAGWHMRQYKEYKWFQAIMSVIPWVQAISIMVFWGTETSVHRLWIEMAIGALGGGAIITTLLTSLIACVEPNQMSLAISACYLFRAIGQVIGVAIAAAIQQLVLSKSLHARLDSFPDAATLIKGIIEEPATFIPGLEPFVKLQARMAYLRSIEGVFVFVTAGGIFLTGICLIIKARPLH